MGSFFEFRQNNTGGSFEIDDEAGISILVIVEADGPEDANRRAQELGIYFDGCEDDRDCSCCGDRWSAQWSDDQGEPVPSQYGVPLIDVKPDPRWPSLGEHSWAGNSPEAWVHLKDGRKFGFHKVNGVFVYKGDTADLQAEGELTLRGMKELES